MSQSRTPLPGSGDRLKELVQTCQFDAGYHAAGVRLHLASSHPAEPLWQLLLARSPAL